MEKFTMNSVMTTDSDGKKTRNVILDMDGRKFEASYDVDDPQALKMFETSVRAFMDGEKKPSAIEVGSKVVIKNHGDVYHSYEEWALKNLQGKDLIDCGRGFESDTVRFDGSIGTVVHLAPHGSDPVVIAAVKFGGVWLERIFLIDIKGLALAEDVENERK